MKYAVLTAMQFDKYSYLSVGIEVYAIIIAEAIPYSSENHALSQRERFKWIPYPRLVN